MQIAEIVQWWMSRYMATRLKPIPVCTGILKAARDWRKWLDGLDLITFKQGVENISGAHWLAFVRRSDVPLCWAALDPAPALGSEDTSPNDVMLLAKTFMSDANLMQPPVTMLRAGASAVLQPFAGPDSWEPRKEIDVKGINRLCKKVEDHIPSRAAVVPYLKTWMAQPRVPPMPVPEPACLQYWCRDQARLDLEQAISGALHRPVKVRSRWL